MMLFGCKSLDGDQVRQAPSRFRTFPETNMLQDDPQLLFERFSKQAKDYLNAPNMMAALELDNTCMQLYPLLARVSEDMSLSNQIRNFGRSLPRSEAAALRNLLEKILADARASGLVP